MIKLKTIPDGAFLDFTRNIATPPITLGDVDRAGDVRLCGLWLYTLARTRRAERILEIGCADGSTTVSLLKAAMETGGIVDSVDVHECNFAVKLVHACFENPPWTLHQKGSDDFFSKLDPNVRFQLVFVDGDHSYQSVLRDILNSWWHLDDGGYLVLHDWSPAPAIEYWRFRDNPIRNGVGRALRSALPYLGKPRFIPVAPIPDKKDQQPEGSFCVLQKRDCHNDRFFDVMING